MKVASTQRTLAHRNFGLDLLRLVAMAVVLANHAYLGFFVATGLSRWTGWRSAISVCSAFSIEWLFVLSGFLIGSMMIRSFETRNNWWASARDFWLRRWFRTLPNYYLFLLVNVGLFLLGLEHGVPMLRFAFFAQNLAWPQETPHFFGEAWSLALDEWFYALMPLLLWLAYRVARLSIRSQFLLAAILLIAIPLVLRMVLVAPASAFEWDQHVRRVTVFHLDATGWGVLAAIVGRWHGDWWFQRQGCKALAGLGLIAVGAAFMCWLVLQGWQPFAEGRLNDWLLITAPAVGTMLLLPWLSNLRAPSEKVRQFAGRLGDYSYSIYLSHFPIMLLMVHGARALKLPLPQALWWLIPVWLLAVTGVSALVFHTFEKPVSDLRERFTRRVAAGPFARP